MLLEEPDGGWALLMYLMSVSRIPTPVVVVRSSTDTEATGAGLLEVDTAGRGACCGAGWCDF